MSRWKIVVAVAVALLLFAAFWMARTSVDPAKDVDAYKQWLVAHGEKLEISQVLPPPVPPDQNGADILNEAYGLLIPDGDDFTNRPPAMRLITPAKAIVSFKQPDVRGYDFTNSWSNVMAVAEADRPATELLTQLINYPALDFHLDYSKGPDLQLWQIRSIKYCESALSARAICDLHIGDAASATTNICVMLAIVNGEQDERLLISQILRWTYTSFAAAANWELLQSTNVNDAELAMLQKSWKRLEFVRPTENAVLMERAVNEVTIKKMRASNEYANRMMGVGSGSGGTSGDAFRWRFWGWFVGSGSGGTSGDAWQDFLNNLKLVACKIAWRVSWTYSDELQMLKNDEVVLQTLRSVERNHVFDPAYTNMVSALDASAANEPDNWLTAMDEIGFHNIFSYMSGDKINVEGVMAAEARRQMVIAAIALKRYQLKHGNYPAALSDLSPEFLPSVPLDPIDGKPLRYRRNADGTFLLYSIGANGKDDGGDASGGSIRHTWPSLDSLDWVWPRPATD